MIKVFIAIVSVVVLLSFMPVSALAAERIQADAPINVIISPMYVYFTSATCNLTISGGSTANMGAAAQCVPSVTKIRIVAYLQQYNGGWQNINSWSQYYYTNTASWSQSDEIASGYSYRLYVYFYAYTGTTLVETATRTDT